MAPCDEIRDIKRTNMSLLVLKIRKECHLCHLTYFHYSKNSLRFSLAVVASYFFSYFVHNCPWLTILDTFAYEAAVLYELDHSILLVLHGSNRATVKI